MRKDIKSLYELVRVHLRIAVLEEMNISAFNLSGRGHEPRVILDRRLAGILRGAELPFVYISGYGANFHYPLRVFVRAHASLAKALKKSPLAIGRDQRAYIDESAMPKPTRASRLVPATQRNRREEMLRRGWGMRGAWAEKSIGSTRLVLSGRSSKNGIEYISLSFHPRFSVEDALRSAQSKLENLSPPKTVAEPKPSNALASFLEPNDEYGAGFFASLMDGPSVNLFEVAGLEYSDELHDRVWGRYNWQSLIGECGSATVIETGGQDDMPGMSDTFYWVSVDDEELFRCELRSAMLA